MIRFFGGRVLSFTAGLEISDAEVWTSGDKIFYVGPRREDAPDFEREIDLCGNLLIPGFKSAHTHSAMVFARSLADDMPLQPWLFTKIFPLEAKLLPEHIYSLNKLAVMEYLTSGITASFDMYYHREAFAQSNIDCGFRSVICGVGGEYAAMEAEYSRFNALSPLISYIPGFHAEYTASMDELSAVAALAARYKAPVFAHNSETEIEVLECISRHGKTPTELFDALGMFEHGGGGFHCVHFSENDIEIFAQRGAYAVTCPGSNGKLASGTAPLSAMLRRGVPLAIGTDGASSNNALDFFREMYLSCVFQKLAQKDAAAMDADTVLRMATVGGAQAMGLFDCDTISEGKQADLVVIDLQKPNMQPVTNVTKNLVYSGSKANVALTMVAGRILYENGEFFIGEEAGAVFEKCNKILLEITA